MTASEAHSDVIDLTDMTETVSPIIAAESSRAPMKSDVNDLEQPVRPTMEHFEIEANATPTNVAEDQTSYPKGVQLIAIIASLAVILVACGLDLTIVAVTIPALSDQFETISDIAWYSTTLRLVWCSFMFVFGKAYTLFSVKSLFLLSLITFELGNALCTFAQTSIMFIAGRAICGFGSAGLYGGVYSIFTRSFPLRQRALVGGIGAGIESVASISSPLIGGALITGWTWRACFGINIPLGLFGCAVIHFFLKLDPNPDESLPFKEKIKRLDLLGSMAFVLFMVCLMLAMQWGGTKYRWNSAQVIALLVLSLLSLAIFLVIEWKSSERAILPFRILKNRSLLFGAFFALCSNATTATMEYYMSIYFQSVRGYTAAKAGVLSLPLVIGMCVAAPLAGAFTTWVGYYFPNMYVNTILSSIAIGILTTIDIDSSLPLLLSMLGVLGFACGAGIQSPQVAAQTVLDPSEVSIGIAIIQFGQQMGPALFLSATTALFTNRLEIEIKTYAPSANITSIENMGLTDIRNLMGEGSLKGVLTGYNEALVQTLYLPLALACVSIVGCIGIERKSVKKRE